ncbi:MAG: hypothetical protein WB919_22685 [Candidatus Sulfotelmatobacter sp.]
MPDSTVSNIVITLAPAFAAGFAVQQGLQILDGFLNLKKQLGPITKTGLAGVVSLGLGIAFAAGGIHVLGPLYPVPAPPTPPPQPPYWLELLVSGLVISAGTEGFNSIMKFIGYKKDDANPNAPKKVADAKPAGNPQIADASPAGKAA